LYEKPTFRTSGEKDVCRLNSQLIEWSA
jgi:hypothetical protein